MEQLSFPGLDLFNLQQLVLLYFFLSLRISALLLSMPFFSIGFIPLQVRIVMSIGITLFVLPEVKIPEIMDLNIIKILIIILSEITIGLSVGLLLSILFSVASVAGEKISSTAGLSMANMIDPQSGGQTLIISTVLSLFMISIFLSLDGHLFILKMIIESYSFLPIGIALDITALGEVGIKTFGRMLYLSSLVMLPIVAGMMLINLAGGVITRSAPSLNLFSFIFPVTMITVFIFLYMGVGPIANAFSDITSIGINLVDNLLHSQE